MFLDHDGFDSLGEYLIGAKLLVELRLINLFAGAFIKISSIDLSKLKQALTKTRVKLLQLDLFTDIYSFGFEWGNHRMRTVGGMPYKEYDNRNDLCSSVRNVGVDIWSLCPMVFDRICVKKARSNIFTINPDNPDPIAKGRI